MVDKFQKSDLDFLDFTDDKTINELIKGGTYFIILGFTFKT